MTLEFEIEDEVVKVLGEEARAPRPEDSAWEIAKKSIWTDREIAIANAQVLLRYFAQGKIMFKE
jgi:hypothetical protein